MPDRWRLLGSTLPHVWTVFDDNYQRFLKNIWIFAPGNLLVTVMIQVGTLTNDRCKQLAVAHICQSEAEEGKLLLIWGQIAINIEILTQNLKKIKLSFKKEKKKKKERGEKRDGSKEREGKGNKGEERIEGRRRKRDGAGDDMI